MSSKLLYRAVAITPKVEGEKRKYHWAGGFTTYEIANATAQALVDSYPNDEVYIEEYKRTKRIPLNKSAQEFDANPNNVKTS